MVPLSLVPSRTTSVQQPDKYTVNLYFGDYANLVRMERGWTLTVHPVGGRPIDRGVFATPQDAIAVLQPEVTARVLDWAIRKLNAEAAAAASSHSVNDRTTERRS